MSGRARLLIVNPNTSASVTRWLADEARRVAGGLVEVAAVNAPSGLPAIETPDDLARAALVIVATIEAEADADAAIIGAFGDPGLMDARARLSIPIVGLGEAGLRAAAKGRRFSIVTLGERCGRRLPSEFGRLASKTGWRRSAFCRRQSPP